MKKYMEVEVKLYKQINTQTDWVGILMGYSADALIIQIDEQNQMEILKKDIAMVKLTFDF